MPKSLAVHQHLFYSVGTKSAIKLSPEAQRREKTTTNRAFEKYIEMHPLSTPDSLVTAESN